MTLTIEVMNHGALKLSDAEYESYQNALRESRNEWNRDIYNSAPH